MQTAVAEFLSGFAEQVDSTAWPLELEVAPMASSRVADVGLLLGLIAVFWGLGRFLKSAGMPHLRPFVLASGLTGILLLFFSNSAFWTVKGLKVDDTGVTLTLHLGEDQKIAWTEISGVRFDAGKLYPAFSDDSSLVLLAQERELAIPRFIPDVATAARRIDAKMTQVTPPSDKNKAP